MSWSRDWPTWLAIISAVAISNSVSSDVNGVPNALHVTAGNASVKEEALVDPNGYVLFCPCMGEKWEGLKSHVVRLHL